MFDLRYHVASLAAVFIAIAVGIVIGVAIASGGSVDQATKSFQQDKINELNQELDAVRVRAKRSQEQQQAIQDLMDSAYPALMAGRLANKRIAVLFLGPIDSESERNIQRDVEQTLTDAGPVSPVSVTALKLPIDAGAIDSLLGAEPTLAAFSGDSNLRALGKALAAQLVSGGESSLWTALSSTLVEQRTGAILDPVDGVVIVRSWVPVPDPTDGEEQKTQVDQSEELISGLLEGLRSAGIAAVGAEQSTTQDGDSTIDRYKQLGVSTVDDVDTLPGRVALALLLAGAQPGNYGVKDSSGDGVTPPVEPLPQPATVG